MLDDGRDRAVVIRRFRTGTEYRVQSSEDLRPKYSISGVFVRENWVRCSDMYGYRTWYRYLYPQAYIPSPSRAVAIALSDSHIPQLPSDPILRLYAFNRITGWPYRFR